MGASESLLSRQQPRPPWADEITTVSEGRRDDADADPLLRRIRSLTIVIMKLSCSPFILPEDFPYNTFGLRLGFRCWDL
jgi:hypothetical protein